MGAGDDADAAGGTARAPGLRAALARVAAAALGLVATRAELLGVELAEERERLTQRLALAAAGGALCAFAALYAGAFVIVLFWETHRLAAIAAVGVVHAAAGAFLLVRAKNLGAGAPPPFAASLDELRKDRARLERALEKREEAS